jgi:hypothetical protein
VGHTEAYGRSQQRLLLLLACAAAAGAGLAGLPVVAAAQAPPSCPDEELAALDPSAGDELVELRGLRQDLRRVCEATVPRQEAIADALGGPLTVIGGQDPLSVAIAGQPVDVALTNADAIASATDAWPQEAQAAHVEQLETLWAAIGVACGLMMGYVLYRAVIG